MDEGKPTKAKWWSRPRPQEPTGDRHTADDDFELARPAGPVDEAGPTHVIRPEGPTSSEAHAADTAPVEAGSADAPPDAPGTADAAHRDAVSDASGRADAPGTADAVHGGVVPHDEVFGGTGSQAADPDPGSDPGPGVARVDVAPDPAAVAPVAPESVAAERPKPLHDPDPYSTPPYGQPGPWAPAPPVQHPAVASAPGPATAPAATVPASVPQVPQQAAPNPAGAGPCPVPADAAPDTAAAPGAVHGPDSAAAPAPDSAHGTVPAALADSGQFLASSAGSSVAVPSGPSVGDTRFDPWQRYDPWAAASRRETHEHGGPWQHSGAEVLAAGERRRWVRRQLVAGALAVALVSGVLGGAVGVYLERNGGLDPVRLPQASAEPAGRAADSVAGIAARALPSVVTLHVSGKDEGGTGTGFVLDSLGYILTNNHVVEPAGSDGGITVVFNGGQTAKAEVVGRDSGYDLAVVRVTGVKGLKPLYLGNSDNVRVGDPVVAIGAPFDLEGTVTSGIISAKERPITAGGGGADADDVSYVDALQTDAPINPGNSGGPLLDAQGHVIGINSAIRSADAGVGAGDAQSGSIGLGFAIPINQGKRVAEELINNGRATHPVIGVTLDLQYAGDGARISAKAGGGGPPVTAGGPGARAGLRAGDVVTQVDGQRVHSGEELIVRTRAHRPGDRLRLTILRDGAERSLTLVLGSSGGG
ncbi:S1C family serine protease [Streptomyces sp. NBC_00199]|uniref:S1C family serine protease n=1 Tax=Streptomyces sp. NBC_00199 TaxID=2975678 RepID=UPI002259BD3B|nr:trypsin-like peptidase domain-containing protein [Streptomyces sp. NBC_00199]MCX5267046.1 trypsin-like peptidase domain-containing protein [Streptomyces sp. NBC_00199]